MPEVDVYVMRWADDVTAANPVSIFQKISAELSDPAPDPPRLSLLTTFRSSLAAPFCLAQPEAAKTLEVARHTSPTDPMTFVTAETTCTNVPVDQSGALQVGSRKTVCPRTALRVDDHTYSRIGERAPSKRYLRVLQLTRVERATSATRATSPRAGSGSCPHRSG